MSAVYVLATASTVFRRHPERDFRDLAGEVIAGLREDAGADDALWVDQVWFGNCAMASWGQGNVRGQVVLAPWLRDGTLEPGAPVINVEAGCATGSAALHGAFKDIASGCCDLSLAIGVEKTFHPDDPAAILDLFLHGADRLHPEEWRGHVAEEARTRGDAFEPHPYRVPFVDVHALQARHHMRRYGTTAEQLAVIASKNHIHAVDNPLAQYRKAYTPEQVLADKPVVAPFTRSMCAPISDGAAGVLLCSERWLETAPELRDRAIRVRACALAGGRWRGLDDPGVVADAARRAYVAAGIDGSQVQLAEVHDATAYCELAATEHLGLCPVGEGGPFAASGATTRDGAVPVNVSGGLESKGHPLAATGLGQIHELVRQLRGEAGDAQVPGQPTLAVQQNAGGLVALDEAVCAVTVLER